MFGNGNGPGKSPVDSDGGVPGKGVPSLLDGMPPGLYEDGDVSEGGVPGLLDDISPGAFLGHGEWDNFLDEGEVYNIDQMESYEAISTAIDDANDDDTIMVGEGTYEEMVTIDKEGLTLKAADEAEQTIIKNPDDVSGGTPIVNVEADESKIEGITVNIVEADAVPSGISLSGDETKAVDNILDVDDALAPGGQTFISGSGDSVEIDGNELDNGIVAYWGDDDATLTNNTFEGEVADEALWSTTEGELTVKGNDFTDVDTGGETVKFTGEGVTVNGETGGEDIAKSVFEENDGVESVKIVGTTYEMTDDGVEQAV